MTKTKNQFELVFCAKCLQMTNHLNGVCQKCIKACCPDSDTSFRNYAESDYETGSYLYQLKRRKAKKKTKKSDVLVLLDCYAVLVTFNCLIASAVVTLKYHPELIV